MHPFGSELPLVNTPPAPRPLGSPFHPKGDSAGDEEPVDSDSHICFRNPIEQDTPSHIRARRTTAEVVATLKLPIRSQSLWEQLIRRDAKTLRKLPGRRPAEDSLPPPPRPPLPPRSSCPDFHRPPTPLPSTPTPSPESSPMPPFPPTPPSPTLGSPKWPSTQPISPSSTDSDDVEIVEDNTGMAIEIGRAHV